MHCSVLQATRLHKSAIYIYHAYHKHALQCVAGHQAAQVSHLYIYISAYHKHALQCVAGHQAAQVSHLYIYISLSQTCIAVCSRPPGCTSQPSIYIYSALHYGPLDKWTFLITEPFWPWTEHLYKYTYKKIWLNGSRIPDIWATFDIHCYMYTFTLWLVII